MINILSILVLCITCSSYSPLYGCFYNQKIRIANSTYFNYTMGGYNFGITWTQPQGNITKYAYTLVGYRSQLGNSLISFKGSLINVTSTGAIFLFEPQNGTSISYAVFSIVLVQTCSGYIELQFIQYIPTQISKAPASRNQTQNCRVNLSRPVTTDYFNYQLSVHLSAFYMTLIGSAMEIAIAPWGLNAGVTYINANMVSRNTYSNIYTRVWFTFILLHIPSFTQQISSFSNRLTYAAYASPSINNFQIPSVFNQGNFGEQCVFSISDIFSYATNQTQEISYLDQSNSSIVNISSLVSNNTRRVSYSTFCMQNCSAGYFVTVWGFERCGKCWDFRFGCEQCTYISLTQNLTCIKCFDFYFMLVSMNQCYDVCPHGYFGNTTTYQCDPCNSVCHACADTIGCISCKVGWPMQGGCTTIQGCQIALSPVICSKCNTEGMFQLVSRSCRCVAGYFLVSHLCTNVVGCVGTTLSQGRTVCLLCDSMKGYVLVNGLCVCKDGFIFNGSTCIDLCGDGKIIVDECDDGNTENGDGCSSTCIVEKNYHCLGKSFSKCAYQRLDISLSVTKISKIDLLNQALFVISITPAVGVLSQLNFTKLLNFSCNQSTSVDLIQYSNGMVKITVNFFENLQGNPARIFLTLDSNYFRQLNTSISFDMVSNGAKLILSDDIGLLSKFKIVLIGLSVVSFAVFAASAFVHKMIGVELIFPLQTAYLVHMVNSNYSQPFGILKYLGFTSWNLLSISQSTANIDSVQHNLVFSSSSQQYTFSIVAGLLTAVALAFAVTYAVKAAMVGQEHSPQRFQASIQKVLVFLYKNILFPCTIAFLPTFFLIASTRRLNPDCAFPFLVEALFFLFMVAASLVFFHEWRVALVTDDKNDPFQGLPFCSRLHIPFYLTLVLLQSLLLSYSFLYQCPRLALFAAGVEALLLLWMVLGQPYQSALHNVGVLANLLPAAIFLIFAILRDYQSDMLTTTKEMELLIAIIGSTSLSTLASLGRIAFQLYVWWRVEARRSAELQEARLRREELLDKLDIIEGKGDKPAGKQIDMAFMERLRKQAEQGKPLKQKGEALSAIFAASLKSKENTAMIKREIRNKYQQKRRPRHEKYNSHDPAI